MEAIKVIIPKEYKNQKFEMSNSVLVYEARHGAEIKKGDVIAKCHYSGSIFEGTPDIEFSIISKFDGYFYAYSSDTDLNLFYPNKEIGAIYDSMEELCEHRYHFSYNIGVDATRRYKKIKWNSYDIIESYSDSSRLFRPYCSIELNLKENRPILYFTYKTSDKCGKSNEIRLKKGDKLYFCNTKKSYLELEVIHPPHASSKDDYRVVDFYLLGEDIEVLLRNKLQKIVIEYKDGRPSTKIDNSYGNLGFRKPLESSGKIFNKYINAYKQALQEAGLTFGENKKQKNSKIQFDPCYVYLMYDSKNGYHKIGISKTPKYREKTLQSEKPTIDLVCSKEYPSRKIAEAIESALHKAFEENRIRGEWFELSDADVTILKETLK